MSSKGSAQRLQIECHHNLRLRVLFSLIIFLAAVSLLVVPLSRPLSFFTLLLWLSLAWRAWLARCELGGQRVSLLWDSEGRWWWLQWNMEREVQLDGSSYLSTWLIVLNFREPVKKGMHSLLLFPSDTGEELFRRLTVRLKLEGSIPAEPDSVIDTIP